MAKVGEMIESKYLKQSDVDEEMVVTIEKVGKGNIAKEGDEPDYKWMVRMKEFKKPMILNSTNIKRLAKACESEDTEEWIGKQVTLYVDHDVEFAGNVVGGLRFKGTPVRGTKKVPGTPGTALSDLDSDVPFN